MYSDSAGLDPDNIEAPVKKKGAELTDEMFGPDDEDEDQVKQTEDGRADSTYRLDIEIDTTTSESSAATRDHATPVSDEEDDQPVHNGVAKRGNAAKITADPDAQDSVDADPHADEDE